MLLENSKTQTSLQTHAHIAYIGMNAFLIKAFICRLARREEREGSTTANNYKIVATTVMIVHCRELKRVVNPNQGRGRLHLPLFVFLVGSFGCKCAFLWHQCITIISDCKFVSSMQFSKSFCASFLESPPLVALSGCCGRGQGTGGYT